MFAKYNKLIEYLTSLQSVAVAFSGGVDSTFLLYAAKEALGDKAIAVTASLNSFPDRELKEAKEYCEMLGVKHVIVSVDELSIEGFSHNPPNRCYICKKGIFGEIIKTASDNKMSYVVEGSNFDDNGDYRPGLKAIEELGVISPLKYVGLTKQEIRCLSGCFKIPTWDKPSYACLSSRFPYGEEITKEKLLRVDKSEQLLINMGFKQMRVRIHGDVARIEIDPSDFDRIMKEEIRNEIYEKLSEYGFLYVALDLKGYKTGNMNKKIVEGGNE